MARTVKVELEAAVEDYVAGVEEAEKATGGLEDKVEGLGITATGTGKEVGELGDKAEELGVTAKESSEGVDDLGKKAEEAGVKARAAGREVDEMRDELKKLDRQIAETEASIVTLNRAFAQTGNKNFLKEVQDEKKALSDLSSTRKSIDNEIKKLNPEKSSQADDFTQSLTKSLEKGPLSPNLLIAIGAIGIAAAPAIGAAVSGAVVGTVGTGGILGGIYLASRDPRVQAAWSTVSQQLQGQLTNAAAPFVDVTLKGITQVGGAVKDIHWTQLFADAAKQAGPFLAGLSDGIRGFGNGLTEMIHNAGPSVKELGEGLGDFLTTVGEGLAEISGNSKADGDALHNLFTVIDAGTESVFGLLAGLTDVYEIGRKIGGPGLVDVFNVLGAAQHGVAGAVASTVEQATAGKAAFDQYGHAILTTGAALQSYADKAAAAAAAGHSLFDSATDVGTALAGVKSALKANGKTLDENTEKGRANRTALSQLATALLAQYTAYVKVNGEGAKSNGVAASNRAEFIKLATALTGSKTKAAELATELGLLPVKKNIAIDANTHDAAARIKALQEQVNNLRGKSIEIAVSTNIANVKQKVNNTLDRLGARAEGGPVKAGTPYIVGEHRPEVFVPDVSGKIVPSLSQYAAMSTSATPAPMTRMSPVSSPTQKIVVEHHSVVDFANADTVMGSALIKLWRTNSGIRTTTVKALGLKAAA